MKKQILLLRTLGTCIMVLTCFNILAQEVVHIPDENFKAALLANIKINTNGDDEIQVSETEGITGIDVSGNDISNLTGIEEFTELLQLTIHDNNLISLDVSDMGLDYLGINNNQLTSLNLGGIVEYLDAVNNDLSCIQTSNPDYYEDNINVNVDEGIVFSTDCSAIEPDVVYIPDTTFKEVLVSSIINTNGDNEIQFEEAEAFSGTIKVPDLGIADLTGIEAFTALKGLHCHGNKLTKLDLSDNPDLTQLWCNHNLLTSLDISTNYKLTDLRCNHNQLSSLDVSANGELTELQCHYNDLTILDVAANTRLNSLFCFGNELTSLDFTGIESLKDLRCNHNPLTNLQLGNNNLSVLFCYYNELDSLDLRNSSDLTDLRCNNNNPLNYLNLQNGGDENFEILYAVNNPNLACIQVDDVVYMEENFSEYIDGHTTFSTDCSATSARTSITELEPDISSGPEMTIFPNPASNNIYMQSTQSIDDVRVYNPNGVLMNVRYSGKEVDISQLGAGVYFIHVLQDGNMITRRVVVVK